MASEGRDRNFDKALARHLRSAAASNEARSLSAGAASQGATCPDSETLAAYHERSLLPEEMNSWKEHIVGCANCQTILAQLESTDDLALRAGVKDEVLASKESKLVSAERRLESSPGRASPSEMRPARTALAAKSRRAQILRGARWQWLAPAGAMAAGLLVWIAWHENQAPPLPHHADIKVVANQPTPPRTPSVELAPAPPPPTSSSPNPPSALEDRARLNARAESRASEQRQTEAFGAVAPPAKRDAEKETALRKDGARDAPAQALPEGKSGDLEARAPLGAARETVEVQTQAQNAQIQNQYNTAAPKVPGPAPLNQMEAAKKMKAAAPPAAPKSEAASGGVAGYNASTSLELVGGVSNPRLIPAPGSNVIWRAGRAGLLEFSQDGGSSWSRQTSGVLVDLLTGSAPSDKVCWIVGHVGAIVLTTDGGEHWKTVAAPTSEDLGSIRASDELHATIWNAKNTKIFETRDGGLTWHRIANP
ncbi:MAG TPA: hypothetical protein VH110_05410 [Candidatus Acidoferrum sp.]|nr:hypothetical protein [Candidatus Acidoferrum sp.]